MDAAQTKPIAIAMRTVTPFLTCADAANALEFYRQAFGAIEQTRLVGPQGKIMYSNLQLGDSAICVMDEVPEWGSLGPKALEGTPVTIHLYVDDVDAVVADAVAAGAKVTMPVANMFWGDRYGMLEDPFGHRWSVATHVRDVSLEEVRQAMENMPDQPDEDCR